MLQNVLGHARALQLHTFSAAGDQNQQYAAGPWLVAASGLRMLPPLISGSSDQMTAPLTTDNDIAHDS